MRRTITAVADMLILGTLLLSAVLSIYTAVTVFPLNPYWIELLSDYSGGFVRRFLLGEILRSIPGVSPETAGLILLTACYAFVTLSLCWDPEAESPCVSKNTGVAFTARACFLSVGSDGGG